MIYQPKEDSYFLSEILKKFFKNLSVKNKKFLDMGSGSGIQAETLLQFTEITNILCTDIDNQAIEFLKKKRFNVIQSDLFSNIKEKFDFIIFNPPYLPEDKYDKEKDTTGGKYGDEIILEFLKQAKNYLKKEGKIFLLLSSLTPKKRIFNFLKKNYKFKKLAQKNLFFETLEIWLIQFA
ncbi:MAG: Rossmann-like fold-containing protein [Candidatus Pacearchaeota archaeon]